MTRQDAVNWQNQQIGKALDYDKSYGVQCVDYFNFYFLYLTGVNPYSSGYGVAGAKDLWNVPTSRFTKVANNPADANQLPQPGDILIYGAGTYGHVNVCLSADANGLTTTGENEGGRNEPVQKITRSWAAVMNLKLIGWLSFNGFTTTQSNQRIVGPNGVNCRAAATTTSAIVKEYAKGDVLDFKGYVRGEVVSGNNIWFVGAYTNVYCWSGAFTNTDPSGLPDITPSAPVVIPPAPVVVTTDKVIDVSAHNAITDYATVKNSVRGVIAKAGHTGQGYGGTTLNGDPKFNDYKANFGEKLVGSYWYAYCSLDPVTEATNFITAVGVVPTSFTYWLDIEETDGKTNAEINAWCVTFLNTVDKLTNRVCGIYMNRNWFNNYITADTKGTRPIWLAHYDTASFSNPVPYQVAHQYSSTGAVNGYTGNLDMNHVHDAFFAPTPIKPIDPPVVEPPVVTPPVVTPPEPPKQTLLEWFLNIVSKIKDFLGSWKRS